VVRQRGHCLRQTRIRGLQKRSRRLPVVLKPCAHGMLSYHRLRRTPPHRLDTHPVEGAIPLRKCQLPLDRAAAKGRKVDFESQMSNRKFSVSPLASGSSPLARTPSSARPYMVLAPEHKLVGPLQPPARGIWFRDVQAQGAIGQSDLDAKTELAQDQTGVFTFTGAYCPQSRQRRKNPHFLDRDYCLRYYIRHGRQQCGVPAGTRLLATLSFATKFNLPIVHVCGGGRPRAKSGRVSDERHRDHFRQPRTSRFIKRPSRPERKRNHPPGRESKKFAQEQSLTTTPRTGLQPARGIGVAVFPSLGKTGADGPRIKKPCPNRPPSSSAPLWITSLLPYCQPPSPAPKTG